MNRTVKEILKVVYSVFNRRIDERKVFCYAKEYLKKGVYYFPFDKHEVRIIDKNALKLRNVFHVRVNVAGGG
jgi:hypothetical protein